MRQQTKYLMIVSVGAIFMILSFLYRNNSPLNFILFLVGGIIIISAIKNAIERHINFKKTGDPDSSWKDKEGNITGF